MIMGIIMWGITVYFCCGCFMTGRWVERGEIGDRDVIDIIRNMWFWAFKMKERGDKITW